MSEQSKKDIINKLCKKYEKSLAKLTDEDRLKLMSDICFHEGFCIVCGEWVQESGVCGCDK